MTGQSDTPELLKIPNSFYVQNVPFDLETVRTLAHTCKKFSIFRQKNSYRDAYALMNCFVEGNYDRAEKIVIENPDAMFTQVNFHFKLRTDNKEAPDLEKSVSCSKYTSPLQYALEINHERMLAIFESHTKDKPETKEKFENCKKQFPPLDIYRLLDRVAHADYAEAEKLAKANPDLILQHAIYYSNTQIIEEIPEGSDPKFIYGPATAEYISPLKLAFKNYDSYMWTMFSTLTDNHEQFSQQIKEQQEHYNIQPLLTAYDNYLALFGEYVKACSNGNLQAAEEEEFCKRLNSAFNKVGEEQKKMPRHMLLEIFRPTLPEDDAVEDNAAIIFSPSFVWNAHHDFSITKNERPPLQYIGFFEQCFTEMERALPFLGMGASIARGDRIEGAFLCERFWPAITDRNNFSRLYDTRVKEFEDELLAALEKTDSYSLLSLNMR
ncbi:hypothetical protein [Legionella sp. 16cNR16C]|uniref:hypothetical protein n=1 Tax=Legionella sp. 16cNR16C TaxID=2905656 RepID=UPI001E4B3EAA|nr:hypothetical protein [Legionella sp. 16cNR16C]MCE3046408.1 hypothetical protein [Legionella sp. 16cNR16C]